MFAVFIFYSLFRMRQDGVSAIDKYSSKRARWDTLTLTCWYASVKFGVGHRRHVRLEEIVLDYFDHRFQLTEYESTMLKQEKKIHVFHQE